jgi:glutathione S-transferase
MKLVIGNTNYSSWSMRAWLAARASRLPFEEVQIDLDAPDTSAQIAAFSGAGRVPVLIDGDLVVWDSLAICEYLAEAAPEARLLPADRRARAHARSAMAEMHAGFSDLRSHLPMNIRRPVQGRPLTPGAEQDVQRIFEIWGEARSRFGGAGPFLYGDFTVADAYYAPVASRLRTYAVPLGPVAAAYVDAVFDHPFVQEWVARANAETWVVPSDEVD